jgi:hypothetical protein
MISYFKRTCPASPSTEEIFVQRRRCGVTVWANRSVPNGVVDNSRDVRPDAAEEKFSVVVPAPIAGRLKGAAAEDADDWTAEGAADTGTLVVVGTDDVEAVCDKAPRVAPDAAGAAVTPNDEGPIELVGLDSALVIDTFDDDAVRIFDGEVTLEGLIRSGDNE